MEPTIERRGQYIAHLGNIISPDTHRALPPIGDIPAWGAGERAATGNAKMYRLQEGSRPAPRMA